ncbi:MAG: F0F1 ATP synthase subunit B, partial [Pseudomonadota bacterium]
AKEEAAALIEQARNRANQMIEEAKTDARVEADKVIEAAKAEVEQEMNRAKEALRAQVSTLVISGAEQVLESSVDEAKHSEMLDKLAGQL